MLRLIDVHTYYGESHILQGVSLEVGEASLVALLGRNGMGKTTTTSSIMGFNPPRRGEIVFKGVNIAGFEPHEIARMGISLVPQGRRIFPSLNVKENLIIPKWTGRGRANDLDQIFSLFPVLKQRLSHRGNCLSGGELQMLAIARALMANPELLLMDEPSEGLAPLLVLEVGRIIQKLKKQGGFSILLVEQNLSLALKMTDYVYILSKGRIVHESTPQELRNNEEVKSKYLGV